MNELDNISVTMLLCDAAQVMGGKLYILGGGWSRAVAHPTIQMALAIRLAIPWHLANRRVPIRAELVGEDGAPITVDNRPVEILGELEAGRPPGLREGTPLDSAVALNVQAGLSPGRYSWKLWLGDSVRAEAPFEVLPAGTPLPAV